MTFNAEEDDNAEITPFIYVYTTAQEISDLASKEEPMNCRYGYMTLFIFGTFALTVIGCATHTIEHDQNVEAFYSPWLNQSFEEFLQKNPDPKQSTPIGQGSYRHTFVYDIESQAEVVANLLATLGETNTGHDDYYHIYVYVNGAGIIYKVDYRRRTETW